MSASFASSSFRSAALLILLAAACGGREGSPIGAGAGGSSGSSGANGADASAGARPSGTGGLGTTTTMVGTSSTGPGVGTTTVGTGGSQGAGGRACPVDSPPAPDTLCSTVPSCSPGGMSICPRRFSACIDGKCCTGIESDCFDCTCDQQCPSDRPHCDGNTCEPCTSNSHCPSGQCCVFNLSGGRSCL
jgi:hypothetical protein